jgi:CheY-like chemotaxis protein
MVRDVADADFGRGPAGESTADRTAPGEASPNLSRLAVGRIAHDFNNLLGAIIANLDLLGEQPATPSSGVLIRETLETALRGAELAGQLLQMVGQGGGQPEIEGQKHAAGATIGQPLPPAGDAQMPGDVQKPGDDLDRGSETVLVVDDNADMRRVVVRQLAELGYRVLEAEDALAALMVLNNESVDLLFTDVVMPGGLSGYDLARLVLSRWPTMRALITTGFPQLAPDGESASQAHLRRLLKPYRKADLAHTLREVLDD